jgi:phospho-N-acetylmuramoyl-pentapeptide-transferase
MISMLANTFGLDFTATLAGVLLGVFAAGALLAAAFGRLVIPALVKRKLNDGEPRKASDYLNMLHADKKNTPTMGGVFLVPAVLLAAAAGCGVLMLLGAPVGKLAAALGAAAFVMLGSAGLGLYDDYCKLTRRGKDGISGKKKLLGQTVIALVACSVAWWLIGDEAALILPFMQVSMGWLMIPFGAFVMVGAGNAYNLTDGLDGLAGGTGAIAFYALGGAAALLAVFGAIDPALGMTSAVLAMAASGGLLGFLYWNRHPAKVFMGDTGSLSLGALLGFVAVLGRVELLLAVAGGVFVAEAGSVMLQVAYFKATKGRRIFRCSPLHHHFQFGGWHETKVTRKFWGASMVCALFALVLLLVMMPQKSVALHAPAASAVTVVSR